MMKNHIALLLAFNILPLVSWKSNVPNNPSELQIFEQTSNIKYANKILSLFIERFPEVDTNDLRKIVAGLLQQESSNGKYVVNNNELQAVGPLQEHPCIVQDANAWLKANGIDIQYKMSDRLDVTKSIEMFIIYQMKYQGDKFNTDRAIEMWNAGPTLKAPAYVRSVKKHMNNDHILTTSIVNDTNLFKTNYKYNVS